MWLARELSKCVVEKAAMSKYQKGDNEDADDRNSQPAFSTMLRHLLLKLD